MRTGSPCAAKAGSGARGAAGRRRRDLLGGHHEFQRDDDVGLPGADGARTGVAQHQVAQRIGEAAFDPVAHHHAGAGRGGCQERSRGGAGQTHQFILGLSARFAGTGWEIIGSDVKSPALVAGCNNRRVAGTNVERPGT